MVCLLWPISGPCCSDAYSCPASSLAFLASDAGSPGASWHPCICKHSQGPGNGASHGSRRGAPVLTVLLQVAPRVHRTHQRKDNSWKSSNEIPVCSEAEVQVAVEKQVLLGRLVGFGPGSAVFPDPRCPLSVMGAGGRASRLWWTMLSGDVACTHAASVGPGSASLVPLPLPRTQRFYCRDVCLLRLSWVILYCFDVNKS